MGVAEVGRHRQFLRRARDSEQLKAGLKLLNVPRAPKELPVTSLLRNAHGVAEWKLFLNE